MRTVFVNELPPCDICSGHLLGVDNSETATPAEYDSPTFYGSWGYLCERHYISVGQRSTLAAKIQLLEPEEKFVRRITRRQLTHDEKKKKTAAWEALQFCKKFFPWRVVKNETPKSSR